MKYEITTITETGNGVWEVEFSDGPSLVLPHRYDIFKLPSLTNTEELVFRGIRHGRMCKFNLQAHTNGNYIYFKARYETVNKFLGEPCPILEVRLTEDRCTIVLPSGADIPIKNIMALYHYLENSDEVILTTDTERTIIAADKFIAKYVNDVIADVNDNS